MSIRRKKPRRSAFVPRLAVRAAVAVVPACAAIAACSGKTSSLPSDAGPDAVVFTVAAVAYPAYEAGADAFGFVAAVAYPAYESGAPESGAQDAGLDSSADEGPDAGFIVAAVAYPAYEAGPG